MSTPSMDFQYSLRQISEGVRQQDKRTKRRSDDERIREETAATKLDRDSVSEVSNKEQDVPLEAQSVKLTKKDDEQTAGRNNPAAGKKPDSIHESYKGNFLDIHVE